MKDIYCINVSTAFVILKTTTNMMIPAVFSYIAAVNLLKPPCQLARQNTSATPYQHVPSAAPWHHLLVSHCS